ncbi:MAG: HAMP domain-containing histidine kinase [Proteobacteria bacterium]|nr:HAMP domain-containing histidine kinase [Pseudomonadota bacterium]
MGPQLRSRVMLLLLLVYFLPLTLVSLGVWQTFAVLEPLFWGGLVVGLGVALVAFTTTWTTRYLTRELEAAEESHQTDSNPIHIDVADAAEDVIQLVRKRAQIRDVMLRQVREGHLPTVLVDPTEFQQVLINLLNSALYATQRGGEITICTRQEEGGVLLELRDTGTGSEPEVLRRSIFQVWIPAVNRPMTAFGHY